MFPGEFPRTPSPLGGIPYPSNPREEGASLAMRRCLERCGGQNGPSLVTECDVQSAEPEAVVAVLDMDSQSHKRDFGYRLFKIRPVLLIVWVLIAPTIFSLTSYSPPTETPALLRPHTPSSSHPNVKRRRPRQFNYSNELIPCALLWLITN